MATITYAVHVKGIGEYGFWYVVGTNFHNGKVFTTQFSGDDAQRLAEEYCAWKNSLREEDGSHA